MVQLLLRPTVTPKVALKKGLLLLEKGTPQEHRDQRPV
jgi:hypothetical protein